MTNCPVFETDRVIRQIVWSVNSWWRPDARLAWLSHQNDPTDRGPSVEPGELQPKIETATALQASRTIYDGLLFPNPLLMTS